LFPASWRALSCCRTHFSSRFQSRDLQVSHGHPTS